MILCDTNILIEFYKNNPQIVQELRHIGPNQLAVSHVTQAELYFGALNKAELKKIRQHLSLLSPFPLEVSISAVFLHWTFDKMLNINQIFAKHYSTATTFSKQVRELTWGLGNLQLPPKPQVNSPKNLVLRHSVE